MATSGNLSKIVPHWSNIYKNLQNSQQRKIWLIGPNGSGKSTLCQLWMAQIAKNRNQNLSFEAGKSVKSFTLPGIISGNVLKVQTTKPIIYNIQSKVNNLPSSQVIDIPTFALPPFNQSTKKIWNAIDSKVTYNYILKNSKKSCFVFVIDEKFTRAPMDGTKASLISFIDAFRQYPQQLFKCTAIIISKCPTTGFKMDSVETKIEKLVEKIDDPNLKGIHQWFKNIKERKAIYAFNKFSTEQGAKDQAKQLYNKVMNLQPFNVDGQIVKNFDEMGEDLKDQLRKYLSGFQKVFGGLIIVILQIIDSLIKNQETFQNSKDKLVMNNLGIVIEKMNKNQNGELPSPINILSACYEIYKLGKKDITNKILLQIVEIFVKYEIISDGQQIYIGLKQRADFFNNFWQPGVDIAGWDIQGCINNLEAQASKIKNYPKMIQVIKDSFEQGKSIDFYQNLKELVIYFVPEKDLQKSQLLNTWVKSTLQLAAIQPKPKSLISFLQLQEKLKLWKKQELLGNVLTKIAQLLISINHVPFAVTLMNKCGNPYKGIQIMSTILADKNFKKKYTIKDFMSYLSFLQQIGLYQKSYQTCYFLGSIFQSIEERSQLNKYLTTPPSGPKQTILQSFINKKARGLDENEMNNLRQLAQKLQKQN